MCILLTILSTLLVEVLIIAYFIYKKKIKIKQLENKKAIILDSLQERRDIDNLSELLCNRSYKERNYKIMNSIKRILSSK